jgi:hypothetical protein
MTRKALTSSGLAGVAVAAALFAGCNASNPDAPTAPPVPAGTSKGSLPAFEKAQPGAKVQPKNVSPSQLD